MVCTHTENGRGPYGYKGLNGLNMWKALWGKPRLGWMDGVKVSLDSRGMTVEAAQQCAEEVKEWQALVHMQVIENKAAMFTSCAPLEQSSLLWWLITWYVVEGSLRDTVLMRLG